MSSSCYILTTVFEIITPSTSIIHIGFHNNFHLMACFIIEVDNASFFTLLTVGNIKLHIIILLYVFLRKGFDLLWITL